MVFRFFFVSPISALIKCSTIDPAWSLKPHPYSVFTSISIQPCTFLCVQITFRIHSLTTNVFWQIMEPNDKWGNVSLTFQKKEVIMLHSLPKQIHLRLTLKVAFFCRLHQKPKKLKKMSTLKRKNLSISVQRSENLKYIFLLWIPLWSPDVAKKYRNAWTQKMCRKKRLRESWE